MPSRDEKEERLFARVRVRERALLCVRVRARAAPRDRDRDLLRVCAVTAPDFVVALVPP